MPLALDLFLFVILLTFAYGAISAAPWVPSFPRDRKHFIDAIVWKDGMKVYDLGCGDGSVLFDIARRHPNMTCIGYDVSLLPLFLGWARKLVGGYCYHNVYLHFGNLFAQHFNDADVVFIFLLAKSYPKLLPLLARELKDDAIVAVEAWPFPGVAYERMLKADKLLPVYIYSARSLKSRI